MKLRDHLLQALAPRPRREFIAPGFTFYGDSILHSVRSFLAMRALEVPGVAFDLRTSPGDTAANLWRRMPYQPAHTRVVVIQQGTNDIGQGGDPVPYLVRTVRYLQDAGHTVRVVPMIAREGVMNRPVWVARAQMLRDLPAGVALENFPFEWSVTGDGLHLDGADLKPYADALLDHLLRSFEA